MGKNSPIKVEWKWLTTEVTTDFPTTSHFRDQAAFERWLEWIEEEIPENQCIYYQVEEE